MRDAEGSSRFPGKERMDVHYQRCEAQLKGLVERRCQEMNDAGVEAVMRKTRSSDWLCGRQDQLTGYSDPKVFSELRELEEEK